MIHVPPEADAFARLEARLERLEARLDHVVRKLEDTIGMAADAFDAWAAEQAARGADLDERARVATGLIDRLTEPDTAAALTAMVDALPKLEPVVQLATTFEPTTAMLFDMLDEHVRVWQARGIDAEARLLQTASLVERLTDPAVHQHLEALLDAASARPPTPVGPFALLRALSDPDVQRAVGLAVAVAREVGGRLPTTTLTRT